MSKLFIVNNMVNDKKPIRVLSTSRYILKLSNLYNKDGIFIGTYKIPNFVCPVVMVIIKVTYASLELWLCIDESFDLSLVSPALVYCCSTIQSLLIYTSLFLQRDLVMSTIDNLQNTVTRSNYILRKQTY